MKGVRSIELKISIGKNSCYTTKNMVTSLTFTITTMVILYIIIILILLCRPV